MKTKTEYPSAFPQYINGHFEDLTEGMTLRDYFAAAALNGLRHYSRPEADFAVVAEEVSKCAFIVADAMLKAREQ